MQSIIKFFILTITLASFSCETSRFFDAVKLGDVKTVTQMLKDGFDPNQRDSRGYTPLMWAVWTDALAKAKEYVRRDSWMLRFLPEGLVPSEAISVLKDSSLSKEQKLDYIDKALANYPSIVATLLLYGADMYEMDSKKKSAFDIVSSLEVLNILLSFHCREQVELKKL